MLAVSLAAYTGRSGGGRDILSSGDDQRKLLPGRRVAVEVVRISAVHGGVRVSGLSGVAVGVDRDSARRDIRKDVFIAARRRVDRGRDGGGAGLGGQKGGDR